MILVEKWKPRSLIWCHCGMVLVHAIQLSSNRINSLLSEVYTLHLLTRGPVSRYLPSTCACIVGGSTKCVADLGKAYHSDGTVMVVIMHWLKCWKIVRIILVVRSCLPMGHQSCNATTVIGSTALQKYFKWTMHCDCCHVLMLSCNNCAEITLMVK